MSTKLCVFWLGLLISATSLAQAPASTIDLAALAAQKHARVPASLSRLYQASRGAPAASALGALTRHNHGGLYQIKQGRVLIEASGDDPVALKAALTRLGMADAKRFGPKVFGWFPIAQIPRLEDVHQIRVLRPVPRPMPKTPMLPEDQVAPAQTPPGQVGDQGDLAMATNLLRERYAVDGTGVMVGVISDSYDANGGAPEDVAQGRLPSGVAVLSDAASGNDEGRAMMQLIHKVAPGAELAFQSDAGGDAGVALKVLELAGCPDVLPPALAADCEPSPGVSAQVIVDDVGIFTEPFFQVGLWSAAVNAVRDVGVSYYTAAGNSADDSYSAWFSPSGLFGPTGAELHDFDPTPAVDAYQRIKVPVGSKPITFVFQWNDPAASQCLEPCAGAASDFDIALVGDGEGKSIVLAGSFAGNIDRDPLEGFEFKNDGSIDVDGTPGPDEYFNLVLMHAEGPQTRLLKYIVPSINSAEILTYRTNSSTVFGHVSAQGAMAIGAANWPQTPYFGQYPAQATTYSSLGGTPIFFDTSGKPMYDVPQQPWMLAPDGVQVWAANAPRFQGEFYGTSAAAPNAAAAAALLLSYDPSLSPDDLKAAFRRATLPWNNGQAYTFKEGFGWIDPLAVANARFVAADAITVDVTANGKRETLSAGNQPVAISALLSVGQAIINRPVDLYFVAQAGRDWYSLVGSADAQRWVYAGTRPRGLTPFQSDVTLTRPDVGWLDIIGIQETLPARYRFYVGVDTVANGRMDRDNLFLDEVTLDMGLGGATAPEADPEADSGPIAN
ncbi:S8 family serine peptidase [uncultured Thiohalocapsa sp.]|uniref:S8 family serine peptidase n=1 Tax=uncultured Thiohalocapsa sp. TaxID=768990 RepID=UPI0025E50F89|nr:S8 family serine peptidase [uncultured Thiohalocapsa sp.]